MGRIHYIHGAFEVGVHIQQHGVFPTFAVDKGSHARGGLGVIDGNGVEFHACLLHPVLIFIGDGHQFGDAGFAPGCPQAHDHGFAVIFNVCSVEHFAVEGLDIDRRQFGQMFVFFHLLRGQGDTHQDNSHQKSDFFHC